nr:hypothetical protein [Tanacetum cinerariifolium]
HRGLKQGDPLAPYLFILVMESLHISFNQAVDEGLFKGIQLPVSLSISHLFYADDAMFLGEWSHGVTVGQQSSRLSAWDDIIAKLRSRLSKWKVKTLSIGGRLTLLKSVLGASPIYNMSIFKVPRRALKIMEASQKHGGLGVLSFFALNRALLLKWIWRFISCDSSLWSKVIQALYGTSIDLHPTHYSLNWCSIVRELHQLKESGFNFWDHCKKRIGNGSASRF